MNRRATQKTDSPAAAAGKRTARLFALAFAIIGLAALAGAAVLAGRTVSFKSSASRTDGVVVKLESRRGAGHAGRGGGLRGRTYAPVFEFKDGEGRTRRVTSSHSSRPAAFDVGEKISVLYAPQNPDDARIDSFFNLWGGLCIVGGLGLFFAGFGGVLLRKQRRGS